MKDPNPKRFDKLRPLLRLLNGQYFKVTFHFQIQFEMSKREAPYSELPCIRLARGKFELTNQDSAGGKKI